MYWDRIDPFSYASLDISQKIMSMFRSLGETHLSQSQTLRTLKFHWPGAPARLHTLRRAKVGWWSNKEGLWPLISVQCPWITMPQSQKILDWEQEKVPKVLSCSIWLLLAFRFRGLYRKTRSIWNVHPPFLWILYSKGKKGLWSLIKAHFWKRRRGQWAISLRGILRGKWASLVTIPTVISFEKWLNLVRVYLADICK